MMRAMFTSRRSRSTISDGVSAAVQGLPMRADSSADSSGRATGSEGGRADDDDQLGFGRTLVDEPVRQLTVDLDAVAGIELVGSARHLREDVAARLREVGLDIVDDRPHFITKVVVAEKPMFP